LSTALMSWRLYSIAPRGRPITAWSRRLCWALL
jgi:hypothetical protein